MIAAGTAMKAVMSRQTEAEREHSKALRENAEAVEENLKAAQDRKKSYEEFVQTQNEQAASDVAQLDRLRKLNDELNTIVDANGRVKAGEEDRAAFITSQLSSALGMEIFHDGWCYWKLPGTAEPDTEHNPAEKNRCRYDGPAGEV